ncbi:MAG: UPF0149 family protein [Gammaproteobacteria bacterium]|nr:UPF0149 family protein [Gammaproteobacteria bacterium]
MSTELDFETVNQALRRAEAGITASEAHGCLCGLLCAQQPFDAQTWLLHTLIETDATRAEVIESRVILEQLAQTAVQQLNDAEYGFMLLLPDDEHALQIRTLAVSQWCQGFLEGLRLANVADPEALHGDAGEIMSDIQEISKAARFQVDDSNENEADFAELVEFLRAGIRLVYEELHTATALTKPDRAQLH